MNAVKHERPCHPTTPRLNVWRGEDQGARNIVWLRLIFSVICVALLIGCIAWIFQPLSEPQIDWIVIQPSLDQNHAESSSDPESDAVKAITQSMAGLWNRHVATPETVAACIDQASSERSDAMIVYISGHPYWTDGEAVLRLTSRPDLQHGHVVAIQELIACLATRNTPALVLIDAQIDAGQLEGILPEYIAWRLQETLISELPPGIESPVHAVLNIRHSTDRQTTAAFPDLASAVNEALTLNANTDGDQRLGLLELIDFLRQPVRSTEPGYRVVYSTATASSSDIALAPLQRIKESTPAISENKKAEGTTESSLRSEAHNPLVGHEDARLQSDARQLAEDALHADTQSNLIAPTATVAIRLSQLGLRTQYVDSAVELIKDLEQLTTLAEGDAESAAWSVSAKDKYNMWPLAGMSAKVFQSHLPWSAKRDLVVALMRQQQLLGTDDLEPSLVDSYQLAERGTIAALRQLASPVSPNYIAEVTSIAQTAARQTGTLVQHLDWQRRTQTLLEETIQMSKELRSFPILVGEVDDDAVVRYLQLVNQLDVKTRELACEPVELDASTLEGVAATYQTALSLQQSILEHHVPDPAQVRQSPTVEDVRRATRIRLARHLAFKQLELKGHSESENASTLLGAGAKLLASLEAGTISNDGTTNAIDRFLDRQRDVANQPQTTLANRQPVHLAADSLSAADAYLQRVLGLFSLRLRRLVNDSTPEERTVLMKMRERCFRLATQYGLSPQPWEYKTKLRSAEFAGGLAETSAGFLRVAVRGALDEQYWIEIEADEHTLAFDVSGSLATRVQVIPAGSGNSSAPPATRSPLALTSYLSNAGSNETNSAVVGRAGGLESAQAALDIERIYEIPVKRVAASFMGQAVNVRLRTVNSSDRISVPLPIVALPLAELSLATAASPGGDVVAPAKLPAALNLTGTQWVMLPNTLDRRALYLRAADRAEHNVRVRVLGLTKSAGLPEYPVSQQRGDAWLAEQGGAQTLVVTGDMKITPQGLTRVILPPVELKENTPSIFINTLICEVEDTVSGLRQYLSIVPTVTRPHALIRPQVRHNPIGNAVEIQVQRTAEVMRNHGDTPLEIICETFDPRNGTVVSKSKHKLSGQPAEWWRLSNDGPWGSVIGLRIEVNGWPNAFIYEFPCYTEMVDVPLSDRLLGISFNAEPTNFIVGGSQRPIHPRATALVTDLYFDYEHDSLVAGIDVNGDRTLSGDPQVKLHAPVSIGFAFAGIDSAGHLVLRNQVGAQEFTIPTDTLTDGRYGLIAEIHHGNKRSWNVGPQVVVDELRPAVSDVQLLSSLPAEIGKPLRIRVIPDDAGLSGPGSVEVTWAIRGQLEFTAESSVTPAMRLADGSWEAALPTDAMLTGMHQVLVRVMDRAGNISDVRPVSIELSTAEEIARLKAAETTVVRGRVTYVNRAAPNMQVRLKNTQGKEDSEAANGTANGKSDATDTSVTADTIDDTEMSVVTDAEGNYLFADVPAGNYKVIVSGRYRGMDRTGETKIRVAPPQPVTAATIRID